MAGSSSADVVGFHAPSAPTTRNRADRSTSQSCPPHAASADVPLQERCRYIRTRPQEHRSPRQNEREEPLGSPRLHFINSDLDHCTVILPVIPIMMCGVHT